MEFPADLIPGRFVQRINRFLTIVDCAGGRVAAHLPNTGRLREILIPGRPVYLAPAGNIKRKTDYSIILADLGSEMVCVDSTAPATVAAEFLAGGLFEGAVSYQNVRREVTLGDSRYDLVLTGGSHPDCVVEVKGVTLVRNGRALFPDAPTIRGTRHVRGLTDIHGRGFRSAVVFMVMRSDAVSFRPNVEADGKFSRALMEANKKGVDIYAFSCRVTREGAWVDREIEVEL